MNPFDQCKKQLSYKITCLCFCFALSIVDAYAGGLMTGRSLDEKLSDALESIPYREMLYTQSFQKRFSLPEKGIENLDKGLLGIAFELIAPSNGNKFLNCNLHLYVDTQEIQLILANPMSGVDPHSMKLENKFFTSRYPINDEDAAYQLKLMDEFSSRLLIQSVSYPKGITNTESLQHYTINVYPGISHFAFSPPCSALNYNLSGQSNLWLNKISDPQNLPAESSKSNSLMTYKFKLPIRLSKSFAPILEKAKKINKKNRSTFYSFKRKYRAIMDAEKGFGIPK